MRPVPVHIDSIAARARWLKTFFSPAVVRRLAADIVAVHPPFPESAFIRRATAGLGELVLEILLGARGDDGVARRHGSGVPQFQHRQARLETIGE